MPVQFSLSDCDIITCYDPGRTREQQYGKSARNAIVTTACTPDYRVCVLRYWAKRAGLQEIYEEIKEHVRLFKPRCIGVEDVAVQIAIGDAFELLSRAEGFRLPPIEPVRPDTRINKHFRIKTSLQKVGPYGKLWILKDSYDLKSEWAAFPKGRTIDIIDTLSYNIMLHGIPTTGVADVYNARLANRILESKGLIDPEPDHRDRQRPRKTPEPNPVIVLRVA